MTKRAPGPEALQKSINELTRMMAKQGDQLDQVLAMLRRREAELRKSGEGIAISIGVNQRPPAL